MLSLEEKQIRELEQAYHFQMRIATDRHNNAEIAHKALICAAELNDAAFRLRANRALARFDVGVPSA